MQQVATRAALINRLQQNILLMQGFAPSTAGRVQRIGLGSLEDAFPNGVFPRGTIHEMLCATPEQAAATSGLLSGLLGILMGQNSACLWISTNRRLFPPALAGFEVIADRLIFVDVPTEKDVLWAMEEALKCEGLAAVVAEVREVSFARSRRLQLAVEDSHVTGFLLRTDPRKLNATTCVARWQVSPLPSVLIDGLPGVGHPRWQVELLRVRNGSPGSWKLEWSPEGFIPVEEEVIQTAIIRTLKAG